MRESRCYQIAQIAVITSESICVLDKVETLRMLFEKEEVALYAEKQNEEKAKEAETPEK